MSSFLEKLKKGMDIEESTAKIEEEAVGIEEEPVTDRVPEEQPVSFVSSNIIEADEEEFPIEDDEESQTEEKGEPQTEKKAKKKNTLNKKKTSTKVEAKKQKSKESKIDKELFSTVQVQEKEKDTLLVSSKDDRWERPEGELTVDIYQTENYVIVRSAVAGVKVTDLSISLEGDMLIIRGERKRPKDTEEIKDCFCQECHWGHFSRKIILPVDVDANKIEAVIKEGILELKMPIIDRDSKKEIKIKKI